ncbi:MAG: aminodeoxychorismate/anthranilate synthase component II [Chitinophagales bacterium]
MHLLLDNYDSFTYNLYDYFRQLGIDYKVLRSDSLEWQKIDFQKVKSIVLSPGPEKPAKAPLCKILIEKASGKIPILGVCLGHQAIGQYFGDTLYEMQTPVHGKANEMYVAQKNEPLFKSLPNNFKVMRYHSLAIQLQQNSPLQILAKTEDGTIMAIKHRDKNIYGIQFHPESILSEYGLKILENWLKLSGL